MPTMGMLFAAGGAGGRLDACGEMARDPAVADLVFRRGGEDLEIFLVATM
jgi:hypothetical protein